MSEQTKSVIELLEGDVDKDAIRSRKGGNGMDLSYLPSWYVIATANEVFGFLNWSYAITHMESHNLKVMKSDRDGNEKQAVVIRTICRVRVSVNIDGKIVEREDVGHGEGLTYSGGPDFESADKEAVSDALKRALRSFGNRFGNCLYDKEWLAENGLMTKRDEKKGGGKSYNKPAGGSANSASGDPPATQPQKNFLSQLLGRKGKQLSDLTDKALEDLTKAECAKLITKLNE